MAIEKQHLARYNELRQFFLQNGHCYVPFIREYADLNEWIIRIKQSRLQLDQAFVEELESMRFDWIMYNSVELSWQSRYYELVLFIKENNHFRVPSGTPLSSWMFQQRKKEKLGKIEPYQKRLLDEIGFLWSADLERAKNALWMKKYEELLLFKKKHGHLKITVSNSNESLARWVVRLRHRKSKEKLAPKRLHA